jgi:hypothetical protein
MDKNNLSHQQPVKPKVSYLREWIQLHWITLALLIVIVVVFVVWVYLPEAILARHNNNISNAGAYGDIFGSVNALFTSLAFVLLIYTALMQREELKLQRQELELTRDELKKSADAQRELTELTSANILYQMRMRKADTKPECKLTGESKNDLGANNNLQRRTQIEFRFYALNRFILTQISIPGTSTVIVHQQLFQMLVKDRTINKDEQYFLHFLYDNDDDLKSLTIELFYYDIDRANLYIQKLQSDENAIFRVTPCVESFAKF